MSKKIDSFALQDLVMKVGDLLDDVDEAWKSLFDDVWAMHRWIPVSEKVPDSDRYILLSFENFSELVIGRYEVDEHGDGAFYAGDEDETLTSQDMYVNAWMELPERCEG